MKHPASALLLSFFMMTMLILVGISVSVLVIRDIATVRTIVGGTQALYGAEGMSELGLYAVKENLPGYEPSYQSYELSNSVLASATLHAREDTVPCEGQDDSEGWNVLAPNESIQLALFAQTNEGGDFLKNTSFAVDFYVGDEAGTSLYGVMSSFLNSEDILRWKILGLYNEKTEAISEYIPLDTDNARTSRENPSVFGPGSEGAPKYMNAKFYDSDTPSHFYADYPIKTFLADHDYSYLVLTNIIQGTEDAIIYYRLRWTSDSGSVENELDSLDSVVCEYTEISSVGDMENGSAHQLLKTLVREGENLPVFDFVLYHTKDDDAEVKLGGLGSSVLTPFPASELFGR